MSYLDDTGLAYFWTKIKAYVSSFLTWANIQNKPSTFAPSAHSHGNITDAGELGTASRAVVTDGNKKVSVSSVTSTELGYLSGVTSNVQTQLNGKADSSAIPNLSRTISGSGNAVTDITVSGHAITATKGSTFLTSQDISGKVDKSGDTLTGNLTTKKTTITRGSSTTYVETWVHLVTDSADNRVGMLSTEYKADKSSFNGIWAYNTTIASGSSIGSLGIGCDTSGNIYTKAPTPAANSNDTNIATTKWVKDRGYLTSVSGTAGTSLLAWDTENTVYTVGGHAIKVKLPANPNTDTHWTSHLYAGASNGNTNAATTNGNTYLIICDNSTARDRRLIKGTGATTVTSDANGVITINSTDNNTTYSANNGVGLSGTTFYNSGVRSISTGSTNGTISVNTNGTAANVAVKGLGSAAYTASTAYATASHTHSYLPLSGGSMTGTITTSASTPLKLNNASVTTGTQPSSTLQTFYISINEKNGSNYLQQFGGMINKNGSSYIRFYAKSNIANATGYILEWIATSSNCTLQPQTNNIALLGASNNRWEQIWCHQSSINSASDARMKSGIAGIPDEVLDAWAGINWVQFQFNESIAEKGAEKARLHTGLIAQDVDAAFKELGLDVSRYGLFLHDSWDAAAEELDEEGKVVAPGREAGDAFGLRYVEALCVESAYMRRENARLKKRIASLEERIAALEAKLS